MIRYVTELALICQNMLTSLQHIFALLLLFSFSVFTMLVG